MRIDLSNYGENGPGSEVYVISMQLYFIFGFVLHCSTFEHAPFVLHGANDPAVTSPIRTARRQ